MVPCRKYLQVYLMDLMVYHYSQVLRDANAWREEVVQDLAEDEWQRRGFWMNQIHTVRGHVPT